MRRLADAALRRRQAQCRPHRPVEKGVARVSGGQIVFIETAEQHQIGVHQPGFEQTENFEAGMAPPGPRSAIAPSFGKEQEIAFSRECAESGWMQRATSSKKP